MSVKKKIVSLEIACVCVGLKFLKVPKAKTGQNTTKPPLPTGGGPMEKQVVPRKLQKTIPDSVVTFFSGFGTPVALGPRKGPEGLVACLLLAAC